MADDQLQAIAAGLRNLADEFSPIVQAEHGPLWLALDQGGHASRALIFDNAGRQVAQAFAPIGTQHLSDDRVEHDAEEIVQSLRIVIDDVVDKLGADSDRVQGAGLATQRSSIVCWHRQTGAPLSPVLSWQDRRNAALIAQLQPQRDEIQRLTGLVLSPHYGASKLRWCLEHLPAVQQAQQQRQLCCGPLSSYLLHSLLMESPHVVDPANASRTQLWSPTAARWHERLLELFDIPSAVLPTNVPTLHHYGQLPFDARQIPLLACTGDQAAVPFANGALDLHSIYINLGTGAFALAPMLDTANVDDVAPLLRSVLCSEQSQLTFALEGTVNGAANALQWLGEHSVLDVNRAVQALQRRQVLAIDVPIFVNGIGGVGSPYWLPHVESRFVADPTVSSAEPSELAQLVAVIESIAFLLAENVRLMQQHLPSLQQVIVGGGLSACSYLCECIADLTQLPLTRLSERELTGKGLAYLVSGRPGAWLRDNQMTSFAPQSTPALRHRQERWRQVMRDEVAAAQR